MNPCPTIMAGGLGGGNCSQYYLEDDGKPMKSTINKPPYRVPSMTEIAALPWNGFNVASTFSGAGGSCLGYRMAGYRVLWANEFIPIAQASYKANHPDSILDPRDIRKVKPEEVLKAIGLKSGELDLFDGSPPCQAFSTAGKRHKGWGKGKRYENAAVQCNESLFADYIRLLRGLMPKVFVAENVSGLIKGVAKGYFLEILRDLKASGYRVRAKLLDAQWLGVPQARQRVIFVGVRKDLDRSPVFPSPMSYRYSVADALADLSAPIAFGNKGPRSKGFKWKRADAFASGTIGASGATLSDTAAMGVGCWIKTNDGASRKATIPEIKRLGGFPDDFVIKGTFEQQWERVGNSVPPVMMEMIAVTIRDKILLESS